jgi:hypothetical protein
VCAGGCIRKTMHEMHTPRFILVDLGLLAPLLTLKAAGLNLKRVPQDHSCLMGLW